METYINLFNIVVLSATLAYTQTSTPNMAEIQARIQEAQKYIQTTGTPMYGNMNAMPFLTAPIEDKKPLNKDEIEHFIQRATEHNEDHNYMTQKLQDAFQKVAKKLPKSATYDTFVHQSIALSGIKNELDARAKKMGYNDAQEAMVRTTRIIRAFQKAEVDRQLMKRPAQQQEIMKMLLMQKFRHINSADVKAVTPYLDRYQKALKRR